MSGSIFPTPTMKGRNTIPLLCNAADIAQGSPPHSSLPSVISNTIFRAFVSGKSLAQASNESAMGVVPLGASLLSLFFMRYPLSRANGTSNLVSSQS